MPCSTNAASASPLAAVKSITLRFFERSNVAALFCHQTCALRPLYVYTITFRARPQARRICCSSGCPTAIQRSIAPVRSLRHKSASSQLKPPANCSASCACSANASNRTIMRSSVSEGCRANVSECAWKYLRSISLTCPPLQHKPSPQAQSLLSGKSYTVGRRASALFSHHKTICGEKLHFPPKARVAVLAATIVMRYDRLISTMRVQPDDRKRMPMSHRSA